MTGLAAQLSQVSFHYGTRPALDRVDLLVRPGAFLAVVGPNGCGKSTALKVLAGLLKPRSGEVVVDGQVVSRMGRRQLARKLAFLPQSSDLPAEMAVRDLVGMGRFAYESWLRRQTPEDCHHIALAMDQMDVADLAERRLGALSGGQLQRVRMAMALAQNAPLLLLDEPSNHLDLKHQYALLDIARAQARAGRAVVAVLLDLTHASLYADRIALMDRGRVVADGSPVKVLTEAMVESVYGIRTRAVTVGRTVIHLPERALT